MSTVEIYAYSDRISVKPGEAVEIKVSAKRTSSVRAQLVRLIHGDQIEGGPGFIEKVVPSDIERDWPVSWQFTQTGNFLRVGDEKAHLAPKAAFTLYAFILPTLLGENTQVLLSRWSANRQGYALGVDAEGRLTFRVGDGLKIAALSCRTPLEPRVWYFVAASFDPATGRANLCQRAVISRYNSLLSKILPHDFDDEATSILKVAPAHAREALFLVGGASASSQENGNHVAELFNGKIDRFGILRSVATGEQLERLWQGREPAKKLVLASWDTTLGYSERGIGDLVVDTGPNGLNAVGVNRPIRCQTGWNWQGRNDCFRLAPQEYGGIEFHQDALTDCNWETTFKLVVPDLRSGVHAVKLTSGEAEEYVPIFVRAVKPSAAICFLVPINSYLAYANTLSTFTGSYDQAVSAVTPVFQNVDIDLYTAGRPFGHSTYCVFDDGAGVCHSSYHRPIFNMRPKYRFPTMGTTWQFPADLSVVFWLEHLGYDYDLITDEDLHRDGLKAISPYKVVVNGTHCEYTTEAMLDATEDYLASGGRLIYTAGNGYYWVVGFRPDEPWVMEVRKTDGATRAWQAGPGEAYMASTGERSGLWRHRGRPPQKLVGTGFTADGMDLSRPYRRLPQSYDPSVSWIFEGVEGEIVGEHGLGRGGAAGIEVDRYDLSLGTPPHAVILAASEPLTDNYTLVVEDIKSAYPGTGGTRHPWVRADMVYFTTLNGGAVFSPSSIAWGQALPWNNGDNSASQVMKNVLDAFARDGPLPGSKPV